MSSIIKPHSTSASSASSPITLLTTSYYRTLINTIIALAVISFVFVLLSLFLGLCIRRLVNELREADAEEARVGPKARPTESRRPTTGNDVLDRDGIPLQTLRRQNEAAAPDQPQAGHRQSIPSEAPLHPREPSIQPTVRGNPQSQSRSNVHQPLCQPRQTQQPPGPSNPVSSRSTQRRGDDRVISHSSIVSAEPAEGRHLASENGIASAIVNLDGRAGEQAGLEQTRQENPDERPGREPAMQTAEEGQEEQLGESICPQLLLPDQLLPH